MKIRFAQLEAAHAAFGRYAALILAKTRVQSGGCSLPCQGTAMMVKKPLSEDQTKPDFPEPGFDDPDDFGEFQSQEKSENLGEIQGNPQNESQIMGDFPSHNSNFFKEINFFVEHQNRYCTEFVEYVFSAWARRLDMNSGIHASSMAKTSVDENQI